VHGETEDSQSHDGDEYQGDDPKHGDPVSVILGWSGSVSPEALWRSAIQISVNGSILSLPD
jgi:hypothetical protein